jgi:hypothetical protein
MQYLNLPKRRIGAWIVGLGALASVNAVATPGDVDMWDGQLRFDATAYLWVPWISTTAQLPALAGGDTKTSTIQPSQYVKYIQSGILFDGGIQKGDWGLLTDLVSI